MAKAAAWINFSICGKLYDKPVNNLNFGSNILSGTYKPCNASCEIQAFDMI